ncbi:hypothetical protein LOTGIDRAFT_168931 [Lottia gigantea]|uniref:FZ domain-containing protein n=1 Tax=Lottia gigantea TaxID=225164 RepID=V3ZSN2_LOTGI|nr:hypothetical protein LOTGIDRAFT_168931 [Lottia gigantea]ESO83891.1 hypothetical protein LOTGIDRAFT_168931 [Lottia gigantea]
MRAYKEWLCATHLSFHKLGKRTPPCDSFCTRIEQMCPFFRPRNIDTHVGDPGFLCKEDKDIPTDPGSVYGSEPYCYKLCHLIKVNEEFGTDYDTTCHTIKKTPNKTRPYYRYSTSSSRSKHSITLGELVHFLALVWTLRTILQISDIGLT